MSQRDDSISGVGFKNSVVKLWPELKSFRAKLLLGAVLLLCSTVVEILSPYLIGRVVDAVTIFKNRHDLLQLCVIYLGLVVIKSVVDTWQAYVIQSTGQGITHHLRTLVFERIEGLPVSYFDSHPTGKLLTRVINDIRSLSELFTASISVLILDLLIIVGTVFAMFWMEWRLAAIVLVSFPLVIVLINYFGQRTTAVYRKVRGRLSEINAFLGENIAAIGTIQRLSAEVARYQSFQKLVKAYQEAQMQSVKLFALVQPLTNILNGIALGSLLGVGGYWVIKGELSIGVVVSFLAYLRNLFQPIRDLVEKYNSFLSAMVSCERVVAVLDEKTEHEISLTEEKALPNGLARQQLHQALIEFDEVCFKYPSRSELALDRVSFKLKPKERLAIVGATGSGKSTLIRLLLRYYDPQRGEIRLSGTRLSEWDRFCVRRQIGVVHQEIYMFQGTLRENLTLGRDDYTDSYLIEQCKRAQIWDVLQGRGGLDFSVNEGGTNLSIGERQLASLARILIFDTPVLILDEATSSVDGLLEKKLLRAMQETLSTRTSIVIAHRLTTIQRCDEILVLDEGRLKEQGTYSELLAQGGIFNKFHKIHSLGM